MSRLFRLCMGSMLMASVCFSTSVWAAWGKGSTKAESANADLKLGEYKGLKHAIGCKQFENQAGWHGQWDLGNNLSIMLESALFDSGRFVIVEREKLTDVIAEQDLAASGRAAASKVAQTGKLRSARYIGTGAITTVEEAQSGVGGGISFGGVRLGGSKGKAQINLIVKLIDTTTGEIVAKESIVGKAGNTGLSVGLSKWGLDTDVGGFVKTPIGEAAQDCINQAAAFIAKKMEEFPFEGSVIKVSKNGQIIINRGSEFGVEVGQELVMTEQGETLMDPDTGAILGQEEGSLIGKIKVTKVDEKMSYAEVLDGEKDPPAGTVVKAE